MEREDKLNNARQQARSERRDGGSGDIPGPFKLPDESPDWHECRIHNDETIPNSNCTLGFKECWSFGKVVYKRYYRFDGTETSLFRAATTWTGDTVGVTALGLFGADKFGCTYCIRFLGLSVSVPGSSGALQHMCEVGLRAKLHLLQYAGHNVASCISRGCPGGRTVVGTEEETGGEEEVRQDTSSCEDESEEDRLFGVRSEV